MTELAELCIPAAALEQHLVVLGKTGAGKSSALRHIVEHLLRAKKRVCVIDPKGDWWGLKLAGSGERGAGKGFPVIAFGDFKNAEASDVPINLHSGGHVAELLATGNRPALIGFRGWLTGHMVQFWIDFAAGIFKANQGELYLVGDEFHHFAPKGKIMDPQAGKCLHWSNRLLSEGRGLGIVCLIASQRPQKVHNDTLTSCETLVAMRVVHAADRGAVEDWIAGCGDKSRGMDVLNGLAGLPRGEAWVWSPEIGFGPKRVSFPMFTTFDSFAPPQLQKKVNAKGWADVDLEAVKEKLAGVIEEAKANDPRELRKQVAELRKQLREAEGRCERGLCAGAALFAGKEKIRMELKEVPVLSKKERELLRRLDERLGSFDFAQVKDALGVIRRKLIEPGLPRIEEMRGILKDQPHYDVHVQEREAAERAANDPWKAYRKPVAARGQDGLAGADGPISRVQQRILDGLAELEQLGAATPARELVALLADYTNLNSKGFTNAIGGLRTARLIDYPTSGTIALTPEGRNLALFSAAPRTSGEVQERICMLLGGASERILRPLIAAYPGELERVAVAAAAGYTNLNSKGFTNALGRLRTLGFIDYPAQGLVKANDVLFLK